MTLTSHDNLLGIMQNINDDWMNNILQQAPQMPRKHNNGGKLTGDTIYTDEYNVPDSKQHQFIFLGYGPNSLIIASILASLPNCFIQIMGPKRHSNLNTTQRDFVFGDTSLIDKEVSNIIKDLLPKIPKKVWDEIEGFGENTTCNQVCKQLVTTLDTFSNVQFHLEGTKNKEDPISIPREKLKPNTIIFDFTGGRDSDISNHNDVDDETIQHLGGTKWLIGTRRNQTHYFGLGEFNMSNRSRLNSVRISQRKGTAGELSQFGVQWCHYDVEISSKQPCAIVECNDKLKHLRILAGSTLIKTDWTKSITLSLGCMCFFHNLCSLGIINREKRSNIHTFILNHIRMATQAKLTGVHGAQTIQLNTTDFTQYSRGSWYFGDHGICGIIDNFGEGNIQIQNPSSYTTNNNTFGCVGGGKVIFNPVTRQFTDTSTKIYEGCYAKDKLSFWASKLGEWRLITRRRWFTYNAEDKTLWWWNTPGDSTKKPTVNRKIVVQSVKREKDNQILITSSCKKEYVLTLEDRCIREQLCKLIEELTVQVYQIGKTEAVAVLSIENAETKKQLLNAMVLDIGSVYWSNYDAFILVSVDNGKPIWERYSETYLRSKELQPINQDACYTPERVEPGTVFIYKAKVRTVKELRNQVTFEELNVSPYLAALRSLQHQYGVDWSGFTPQQKQKLITDMQKCGSGVVVSGSTSAQKVINEHYS